MAEWKKISPAGIYECSECGQNVMTMDIVAYRHCHGCGALMREYQEECAKKIKLESGSLYGELALEDYPDEDPDEDNEIGYDPFIGSTTYDV